MTLTSTSISASTSGGLQGADLVVLVVYLVVTAALGIFVGRGAKNVAEFFMPRRFGKMMMIMNAFGTGTASDQAVAVASETFRSGISGIWYQWLWLFATPFYWLIAPIFRRLRAVTTADAYRLRFDTSVAALFAIVGVVGMSVKMGVLLKGTGALVESGTGMHFDTTTLMIVISFMLFAYGMVGGLSATIVTDYLQGILTLVFSFILLPFVWHSVGGMSGIRAAVHDPAMLSLVAPGKINLFFIIMLSIQSLVGVVALPFVMGACAAGKTELEGRVGYTVGNFLKRICTVAWCLTGLAAVAWYVEQGTDTHQLNPDLVYGAMAQQFLPKAMPGLLGLFLAAMLASVISSCAAYTISSSALFVQNLYKPLFPQCTEGHYLAVGKLAAPLIVAGGAWFAVSVDNVVQALEIWLRIAPMMGMAFWMGLLWRPMNVAGAWASTIAGLVTWFVSTQTWMVTAAQSLPCAESLRIVWHESGKPTTIYAPWQILAYLVVGVLAGIVVSLITRPLPTERLDRFYALTRTPIALGEKIVEPCTLPVGVLPSARRMWLTACGLEVPAPSLISMWGFAGGWLCVAALIGSVAWLLTT